jgi:hypothetical protein
LFLSLEQFLRGQNEETTILALSEVHDRLEQTDPSISDTVSQVIVGVLEKAG